ncbi:hypothetical protein AB0M28_01495 [Streptomyces sp. NPDC051940]|uniref:hypothetical protein n=1 Tax=Streptomyces sp. NPDC051940 TaxID=3155675 RepID=UPI003431B166
MTDLTYSDGIAAARTMIALRANAGALQRRLPDGWELAPYAGDDLRGTALRDANVLVPFHEVYASTRADGSPPPGLAQVSYAAFVSQARHAATGEVAHLHWRTYTEDPAAVPGHYRDGVLARVNRTQTFTKKDPGRTHVHETFSAETDAGSIHLNLAYEQGGMTLWSAPEHPELLLRAAADPALARWYQEDQVMDVVRADPLGLDRVAEVTVEGTGELAEVFDDATRVVAVVIQRPYMRRVFVR